MTTKRQKKEGFWRFFEAPVLYPEAVAAMEAHVNAMLDGTAGEQVWFLEHPPLYTAGTGARRSDLLASDRFPVFETGRGGKYTYHGPGQRVVYALMDLRQRDKDLRAHVWRLEEWTIRVLDSFGVKGERRSSRVGVWVQTEEGEKKIAALGVRCRRWVTSHGLALNVNPDLSHFEGIVPCGIKGFGVTSLHALGVKVSISAVDQALRRSFSEVF